MGKWLKTTECIRFDVAERVARITLNRPDKRNALSAQMLAELHAALLEADDRTDVHAIVLAGAGKDFCAGYDLAGAYAGASGDASAYRSANATLDDDCWQLEQTQRQTMALFDLHKPVIAQVQGNCLAGGTDLALMCDMVVAADDARIGFPAARANGTPPQNMFIYHVGPQWAKRLLMTGDWISGRDAARIGLVMDSVPADELDAKVVGAGAPRRGRGRRAAGRAQARGQPGAGAGRRSHDAAPVRRDGCARAPVARAAPHAVPRRHGRARAEGGPEAPRRAVRRWPRAAGVGAVAWRRRSDNRTKFKNKGKYRDGSD